MKKQLLLISAFLLVAIGSYAFNMFQSDNLNQGFYKSGELEGDYVGSFVCEQSGGVSGLTITITENENGVYEAVCKFYATRDNPGTPQGSFGFSVELNNNEIIFTAEDWISKPEEYHLFNAKGYWDADNNTIEGKINNQDFLLEKFLLPEGTAIPQDDAE